MSESLRWDREGEVIEAVTAVAAGEDLRSTLERLVRGAVEYLDAQYAALGVLSDTGGLADFIHVGMTPSEVAGIDHSPEGLGVLGLIEHASAPVRVDDVMTHPASVGFPAGHPPMHTFIGAPIRLHGRTFGNFYVTQKRGGGPFTDEDERNLSAFAAVAGIAVENSRVYERAQRRERWLRASTEVTTSILSGADARSVLDLVAKRARECARADGVAIILEDEAGRMVVEVALGETVEGFQGMVANESWKYSMQAQQTGKPVVIDDLGGLGRSDDPGYQRLGNALLLPLNAGERPMGTIALSRERGDTHWDEQDVEFASSFAGQTALALMLSGAQSEQERLAVYVDRDRIARDLHDLVIQRLFATGLGLQAVRRHPEAPDEVSERLDTAIDELDATVREIRQTIFALNTAEGDVVSRLRARVLREIAVAGTNLGFEPHLRTEGPVDSVVPDAVADQLVAALREALSNVVRHAHASSVNIHLQLTGDDVVLTVTDDGVGVFPGGRRSGTENIAQRAAALGGSCTIEPVRADGSGTKVTWRASIL